MFWYGQFQTAFGPACAAMDQEGRLTRFVFLDGLSKDKAQRTCEIRDDQRFANVAAQVASYFSGELHSFSIPLAPQGSPFQIKIWQMLLEIPFGQTKSYGELAKECGVDGAARAVGRANASNPIGLIIPCHRVIGANGALTGYAGGIDLKRKLLAFEFAHAQEQLTPKEGMLF